jgi:hypothetical protein
MHMRFSFARIALTLWAVLPLRLVHAQETPAEVTREEWQCQNAFGRSVVGLGLATAECLAECRSGPSFSCSASFPDVVTRDCLDRALAEAEAHTLEACAGSACPECYDPRTFNGCRGHTDSVFAAARSFADTAIGLLYCNDASSRDGLTRPEQRCRSRLLRTVGRFTEAASRCFAWCNKEARRGRRPVESCDAALLDTPALHPGTQACVDRARARLLGKCEEACTDPPDCFSISCPEIVAFANIELAAIEPQVACEDVPPPVCGDGAVNGFERCDASATPNGCGPGEQCSGCYSCYGVCGDGIRSPSEQCDASAEPDGCGPGSACTSGCFCQRLCGNGIVDPGEECEPFGPPACGADDVCSGQCTCETVESAVEDLTPCSVRDVWEFRTAAGQGVLVRADTVNAATASDLVLSGTCTDGSAFSGDDTFSCSAGFFGCPSVEFSPATDATCRVQVRVFGSGGTCQDPDTAEYRLDVSGTGLTLVADDSAGGAFL